MTKAGNIVLVGPMGAGKSSTGRALAARLGRPFVDIDEEIEARAGLPIPRIFAEKGEPWFRALESEVLRDISARVGQVIAAGGGVVLNPANMRTLAEGGTVYCLRAGADTILQRVGHETHRPLLQGGDKRERIQSLLDQRRALYDAVPNQVPTDGMTPDQVAAELERRIGAAKA